MSQNCSETHKFIGSNGMINDTYEQAVTADGPNRMFVSANDNTDTIFEARIEPCDNN